MPGKRQDSSATPRAVARDSSGLEERQPRDAFQVPLDGRGQSGQKGIVSRLGPTPYEPDHLHLDRRSVARAVEEGEEPADERVLEPDRLVA